MSAQQHKIDSLLLVLQSHDAEGKRLETITTLGQEYYRLNIDSAIFYCDQALALSEKLKNWKELNRLAKTYSNIGVKFRYQSNFDSAFIYLYKGLRLREKINNQLGVAGSLVNIAIAKYSLSEYDTALSCLNKSKDIISKMPPTNNKDSIEKYNDILADAYNFCGEIFQSKGNYPISLDNYLKSLEIRKTTGDKRAIAQTLINIGIVYLNQRNFELAYQYILEGQQLHKEINNKRGIAVSFYHLGNLYFEQKKYHNALDAFRNVFIMGNNFDNLFEQSKAYNKMGLIYIQLGSDDSIDHESKKILIDSAQFYLNKSLALGIRINNQSVIMRNYIGLAQIAELDQSIPDAINYYNKAASIADSIGFKKELFEIYLSLSTTYKKTGNADMAFSYHQKYSALKDSVFNSESNYLLKEMQVKYETEKKDNEIVLLNNRNQLQNLTLKEQQAALLTKQLAFEKKENELAMLNQSKAMQELQLQQSKDDVQNRELENKTKTAQLELAQRDKALQHQELEYQKIIRNSFIAIAILLFIVGAFLINRIQLRKKLENQEAILAERRRISSDMHDDLGSGLSSIAMLSEVVKQNLTDKQDVNTLEKISQSAQQSLEKMSEIVWSLNPKNDSLESLISYVRKYTAEYFEPTSIECKISLSQQVPDVTLSGEVRRNIFLVVKESLHNVIKHANATKVEMNIAANENQLSITIHDNGKGIDLSQPTNFGNGLINMQERMKETGGSFSIKNHNGTTAQLSLQLS